MDKLLSKPNKANESKALGRYEELGLRENPFPANPFVNKDSNDDRINGTIYDSLIRKAEFDHIKKYFLQSPQAVASHLRLGFIIDESYVGRGNGKSAFLINLVDRINKNFCLDLSDNENKCFSTYVQPQPGGRTKSFDNLEGLIFDSILKQQIITYSLAIVRLEAIIELYSTFDYTKKFENEISLIESLNCEEWYKANGIDLTKVSEKVLLNPFLSALPKDFPLYEAVNGLFTKCVTQTDFIEFYSSLKKGEDKIKFMFNDLVLLFLAAGFNGAYLFIDDFERIPDFQSNRQKRDFALELRTCFFDGTYESAKRGFYNLFLVLHAGVPRLIDDAWAESGMERRAPIFASENAHHHIAFRKLNKEDAKSLIAIYLSKYRIQTAGLNDISPFTINAVNKISEIAELNAASILKLCHDLIEELNNSTKQKQIDEKFVENLVRSKEVPDSVPEKKALKVDGLDLLKKAKAKKKRKSKK